jgi:hypothetical protein
MAGFSIDAVSIKVFYSNSLTSEACVRTGSPKCDDTRGSCLDVEVFDGGHYPDGTVLRTESCQMNRR